MGKGTHNNQKSIRIEKRIHAELHTHCISKDLDLISFSFVIPKLKFKLHFTQSLTAIRYQPVRSSTNKGKIPTSNGIKHSCSRCYAVSNLLNYAIFNTHTVIIFPESWCAMDNSSPTVLSDIIVSNHPKCSI